MEEEIPEHKYLFDQKPNTVISDNGKKLIERIKTSECSVLVGRNNCGKSYLLKTITQDLGVNASYLGPARYNNFHVLGFYTPNKNKKQEKYNQFNQQFQQQNQNIDNSPISLQQSIAEFTDDKRKVLFEIIKLLLGTEIEILQTVEGNTMSQKYLSTNQHNISFTSSGFRLIATILTCLLDDDHDIFLIDEPELGISPEAQGILADFLFNKTERNKYFPHIKTLIFATHSTIFLDHNKIQNNYTISKDGDVIDISQVSTFSDFNRIHFFLLGNRFETLYLPSVILLCEGISDQQFIARILELEYPDVQFSVINSNSDSRMKDIVNVAGSILGDIQRSPYRERIIPILDKVHGGDVVNKIETLGISKDNIIVWENNGIEYCYPQSILNEIFGEGCKILIQGDNITANGISYKKAILAEMVTNKLKSGLQYSKEFNSKFFELINKITGLKRRNN
ncbi:ATP-dependent endonuclease [Geojedonia litorea]|uniref:ATP-dependent endonuclease n=1 Tax=Geojedonia litorea TaxID=1268269 RepID=A0ABV9N118_9FLAO